MVKRYDSDEIKAVCRALALLVLEAERHPFEDRLGPYYLEIASKWTKDARGEFYTPPAICDLVAALSINIDEIIERGKPFTVQEPACGAGGMILALGKQFAPKAEGESSHIDLLRVSAIDVSRIACDMTFINTTLWGIPTQVIW